MSQLGPMSRLGIAGTSVVVNGVLTDLDLSEDSIEPKKSGEHCYLNVGTTMNGCSEMAHPSDKKYLKDLCKSKEDMSPFDDIVRQDASTDLGLDKNTAELFYEFKSQSLSSECPSGIAVSGNNSSKNGTDVLDVQSSSEFDLEQHTQKISELQKVIERLKGEQTKLEEEASHMRCQSQLDQLRQEIELLKQEHELDVHTQAKLNLNIETLKKQYEKANKDKEASVMRYAVSEMEVINQRKERDNIDKKYKEVLKDKEALTMKLKAVMIEKAQISQQLDNKCSEFANSQKEVGKLKEELNSREIKIKWTQNKLKSEMESHKESELQVEKLSALINEAKEEVEKSKKDAELAIKQFQCSQENRAFALEQQLKEQQAELILERHTLGDKENSNEQLTREVETLRNKHLLHIDENNVLKLRVATLEKERQEGCDAVGRLTQALDQKSKEIVELREVASKLDLLRQQLAQEKERLLTLQTEASELRTNNDELQLEMAGCQEREAEMLEFTQKVTAKNVRLQNEYSCVEAKARQLECEEEPLQRRIEELQKKIEELQKDLAKEKNDREAEKKLVARHLAEKTAKVETLTKKIEDLKGENQVMKHKHSATLRELTREVAQYRKRLEQLENSSGSESICQDSRTSSCGSLDANTTTAVPPSTPATTTYPLPITQLEPDKQAMIDRILRLQRDNVRLREKIDFLEEHSKQLTGELQKKTRVLQSYIMREESGTLTSGAMDSNKAELARHGGIMASVYGSKPPADGSMTLELSLEINRKLQAVLEDTLLKNITLKENIDTLGDEIGRLSRNT